MMTVANVWINYHVLNSVYNALLINALLTKQFNLSLL